MHKKTKHAWKLIIISLLYSSVNASCLASDSVPKEGVMAESKISAMENAIWTTKNGESLQSTVYRWAQAAGYEIVWDAPYDYPVLASIILSGSYESAMTKLFSAYSVSERPLKVDIYRSQKLVHIEPY